MFYSMILSLVLVLVSQASCRAPQAGPSTNADAVNAGPAPARTDAGNELLRAVIDNNAAAVAVALAKGADPNAAANDPEIGEKLTPLAVAVEKDEKIVRLLLEKGANPNAFSDFYVGANKERRSFSPLMRAAALGKTEIVRLLIDNKADVNLSASSGFCPLMAAASSTDVTNLLLSSGANPNASDDRGLTPLMAVVSGAAYDTSKAQRARLLIEKGADPNAKDKNGRSALDIARSSGDASIIDLLQRGSKLASKQTSGIGFVKNTEVSGCYMAPLADANKPASERRYYFVESDAGGVMNIDGEEMQMTRAGADELSPPKGKKRYAWTFRSANATARFDLTVTKTANDGEAVSYDAVITATKDGKKHSVRAFGFCGG